MTMQYGQIVFILFVAMACYYAFLIFTDIRKAQAAQNAEQENHAEEEIDISDEARNFHPTKSAGTRRRRKVHPMKGRKRHRRMRLPASAAPATVRPS